MKGLKLGDIVTIKPDRLMKGYEFMKGKKLIIGSIYKRGAIVYALLWSDRRSRFDVNIKNLEKI